MHNLLLTETKKIKRNLSEIKLKSYCDTLIKHFVYKVTIRYSALLHGEFKGMPVSVKYVADYLSLNSYIFVQNKFCEYMKEQFGESYPDEYETDSLYYLTLFTLLNLYTIIQNETYKQNIYDSIIKISIIPFDIICEKCSLLNYIYNKDPSGIYSRQNISTRYTYRKMTAEYCRENKLDEYIYAKELINKCGQYPKEDINSHVGVYIQKKENTHLKAIFPALQLMIALLIACGTAIIINSDNNGLFVTLSMLFLLFTSADVANGIVYPMYKRFSSTYPLPGLDFHNGIPDNSKVVTVITSCISSEKDIDSLGYKLEMYSYGNRQKNIVFAVLADFSNNISDNDSLCMKLVDYAMQKQRIMNSDMKKFVFCIRKPIIINGVKTPYERKRGALLCFAKAIKTNSYNSFYYPNELTILSGCKYAFTVDQDTTVEPDSVKELTEIAEHPLNQPILSENSKPGNKTVIKGYGIILPQIVTELSERQKNLFTQLFGGESHKNIYGDPGKNIYQRIFNEGIYTGKGLFNINIYTEVLEDAFPDNVILSHDLLEGAYIRAGLSEKTELADSFPNSYFAYVKRTERWTRGDWQILDRMFLQVKNKKGEYTENPLRYLTKWQIFDNLRRSLSDFFLMVFYTISVFSEDSLCFLIAFFVFSFYESILSFLYTMKINKNIVNQNIFRLIVLPFESYNKICAIVKALYRKFISKKNLLQWSTSQSENEKKTFNIDVYYKKMNVQTVYTIATLFFALLLSNSVIATIIYIALSVIWFMSPYFVYLIDSKKPFKSIHNSELSKKLKNEMYDYAKKTWNYFITFVSKQDNNLPPDNYQEFPVMRIARRTSPTNIGLYLVSVCNAYLFSFIDQDELYKRLSETLSTIVKMKKWKGHLFNWYGTKKLDVLPPEYVSTVDSGNLITCLVTIKGFLNMYIHDMSEEKGEILSVIDKLIDEMNFADLYDNERRLMRIGYNLTESRYDTPCYDLYSSEALLTVYTLTALGKIDMEIWKRMTRQTVNVYGYIGTLSWSGTIFEYLMPSIFIKPTFSTLYMQACRFIINIQKRYCKKNNIPFGISESAYYAFDSDLNYRYRAFGVNEASIREYVRNENVVSPYSSFLVLNLPCYVYDMSNNIRRLSKYCSKYGFYDSIDYSGNSEETVGNYMSHHQGMIMSSLCNLLFDGAIQKSFFSVPYINEFKRLMYEPDVKHVEASVEKRIRPLKIGKPQIKENVKIYVTKDKVGDSMIYHFTNDLLTLSGNINGIGSSFMSIDGIKYYLYHQDCFIGAANGFNIAYNDNILSYETYAYYSGCNLKVTNKYRDFSVETLISYDSSFAVELRHISIVNTSDRSENIKITASFRPIINTIEAFYSHPIYSDMFLDYIKTPDNILMFHRQINEKNDEKKDIYGYVGFTQSRSIISSVKYNDRRLFFSSNNINEKRMTIEPYMAFEVILSVESGKHVELGFFAGISNTENIDFITSKYSEIINYSPSFNITEQAYNAKKESLGIDKEKEEKYLKLLPVLINKRFVLNHFVKQGINGIEELWKVGISGDREILCLTDPNVSELHMYLYMLGYKMDCVYLINDKTDATYRINSKKNEIKSKYFRIPELKKNIFFINESNTVLYDVISSFAISNTTDFNKITFSNENEKELIVNHEINNIQSGELIYYNGIGGFDSENNYVILCRKNHVPMLPWSDVIGNNKIGFVITHFGNGYTWYKNSREYRITPNLPDTVEQKKNGETLFLITKERQYNLLNDNRRLIKVTFSPGNCMFESHADGIKYNVCIYVDKEKPVKIYDIYLNNENESEVFGKLCLELYPELSGKHVGSNNKIQVKYSDNGVIIQNPFNYEYSNICTYITGNKKLNINIENKFDPGIRCEMSFSLRERTVNLYRFFIACGESYEDCQFDFETMEMTKEYPTNIYVYTDSDSLDIMINKWLMYQVYCSRFTCRTGFYQSGGAFGFRDQLQDSMAFLYSSPDLTRKHIIKCSGKQFKAGDVFHWWHDDSMLGLRANYSDDPLWFVYAVSEYLIVTEDYTILYEKTPFIKDNSAESEFFRGEISSEETTVYNHCLLALEYSSNLGAHGIPLILNGDWSDGLNLLGRNGKGESVWLGWFLGYVIKSFSPAFTEMNDADNEKKYSDLYKTLCNSLNYNCWDGKWFTRAYSDNGDVIGSEKNNECKIDLISQCWSVISGMGELDKQKISITNAYNILFDRELRIVKLFSPPFTGKSINPGYISEYKEGIRENGGQYTHAVFWLIQSLIILKKYDMAYEIFEMINPIERTKTEIECGIYMTEPYVVVADIYTSPDYRGRGGWTWYTGSAGWMYRIGIEYILGVKKRGNKLIFSPCLPSRFNGYKLNYKYKETLYIIELKLSSERNTDNLTVYENGTDTGFKGIELKNDTLCHSIEIYDNL